MGTDLDSYVKKLVLQIYTLQLSRSNHRLLKKLEHIAAYRQRFHQVDEKTLICAVSFSI